MTSNWQFSLLAPVYDWFVYHRSVETLEAMMDINPNCSVLDIGGGTGQLLDELSVLTKTNYVVVDRNQAMLTEGFNKDRPAKFIRCDADQLAIEDRSVDRVLLTDALHHIGRPEIIADELKRVSRLDAKIVIEEFNPNTMMGRLITWGERLAGMGSQFLTPDELHQRMSDCGFKLVNLQREHFVYYACFELPETT